MHPRSRHRSPTTRYHRTAPDVAACCFDPDCHARLEARRLSLRVKAQAQRVAVMIPDNPLGLPGGESPEGRSSVMTVLTAPPAPFRATLTVAPIVRTTEMVFAYIEREPLFARRPRPSGLAACVNILAHLRNDDATHRRPEPARSSFQDAARAPRPRRPRPVPAYRRSRVPPGSGPHGRIVVRLGLRHIGSRRLRRRFGLVKRLLRLKILACQRAGSCELGLHIFEAGVCLGDSAFSESTCSRRTPHRRCFELRLPTRGRHAPGRLCRQLQRGEPCHDIAACTWAPFLTQSIRVGRPPPAPPDFGRSHDANDCLRRSGTTPDRSERPRRAQVRSQRWRHA